MEHGVETTLAWRVAPRRVLLLDRPRLIGVLNVTPDSFSDGGRFTDVAAAVARGFRLAEEGADVVEVGGESSRPGASPVEPREQIARVLPVIAGLRRSGGLLLSIDTTSAAVAEAALDAGADIVNDVSAGRDDPAMLGLAARRSCGLVLMHRRLPPRLDSWSDRYDEPPEYEDVVAHVREFLADRCRAAVEQGVDPGAIVIDPGLGFGKTVEQNLQLLGSIGELTGDGYAVMSAASRKSFIGAVTGVAVPANRVEGSVAVSVMHWMAGVRLFRVHDVAAHREALALAHAVRPAHPASV